MAEVVYRFTQYSFFEAWPNSPERMVDGNENSYASTPNDGDVEFLITNNCPGDNLGSIEKVEIRCKGYYTGLFGGPLKNILLRPVFPLGDGDNHPFAVPLNIGAWSPWFGITRDPWAPANWAWANVVNLDCDVEAESGGGWTFWCSQVEIKIIYKVPPAGKSRGYII